jgi:hypothetical protein
MTVSVTPIPAGSDASLDREVVSPELALVDPVLAARARASLGEPGELAARFAPRPSADPVDAGPSAALSRPEPAVVRRLRVKRSWRLHVGVAAVTVASLLLLDVRVQVGQTPAEADSPEATQAVAPPSGAVKPSAPRQTPRTQGGKPSAPRQTPRTQGAKPKPAAQPVTRRFAWAPTQGASAYHVELFRAGARVFSVDTQQPQLTVPARWKLDGKQYVLSAGEYQWFVWPIVGGRRASSATVQASLTVAS